MDEVASQVQRDRKTLIDAQNTGTGATLAAYAKLSGPGWLQSAITLGGGSLAGALFLGVLGGTDLLWLQLVAITMGVVMLSAISYVTLSTRERPFHAINRHINPVLGWGWVIATCMANMIWCMPQFGLCYAALRENLVGASIGESLNTKLTISAVILTAAFVAVVLNSRPGLALKIFDVFLKGLIGMVVICFMGVVATLTYRGELNWGYILSGFVPDISQWTAPAGKVAPLMAGLSDSAREFWGGNVVTQQRAVMIGAAATAVGINMTFLMPYSMLHRGWDKPFRGLARFDLCTGMAIPYVLVTSCVVIASAATFHGKADEQLLSTDPAVMRESEIYSDAAELLSARLASEMGKEQFAALSGEEKAQLMAQLPPEEKQIASSLVKRNAFQLSGALSHLLGERTANLVFGLGIFGMGFSTIIILMLINGFAFCEMTNQPQGGAMHITGCLLAGIVGAIWPLVWDGDARLWLAILASSFGMMLLPIAYITFMMMMNSRTLMGEDKPTGLKMVVWNVLMGISVLGAIIAAGTAIYDKANDPKAGPVVIGVGLVFIVLVILGFFIKGGSPAKPEKPAETLERAS